jgi:translation initiation factor IF-3
VVSENGEQLGVMPIRSALDIAANRDLDLVKVQPNAAPPVCKLMDYGKFRFEQSKKEKEFKKNQHVTETKEIRLSPGIGTHDFDTKLKNGRSFLTEGDRLKVSVRFRGREMAHTDIGRELLKRFAAACEDIATVFAESKLDGRQMIMFLAPKSPSTNKQQEGTQNAQDKDAQRSEKTL